MNETKDIGAIAQAFVDSWNNRELQSIAPLLTADAEFVNALGLWWRGQTEVIRGLQQMSAYGAKIVLDAIQVRVVAAGAAVAGASFTVSSFTGPDGQQRPEQRGVMSLFVVNQGEGWRIASGQITAVNEAVIAQIRARSSEVLEHFRLTGPFLRFGRGNRHCCCRMFETDEAYGHCGGSTLARCESP